MLPERRVALATLGCRPNQAETEALVRRLLGDQALVLWEETRAATDGGLPLWTGVTDNYLRVLTYSPEPLAGRLTEVRLVGESQGVLWGELLLRR